MCSGVYASVLYVRALPLYPPCEVSVSDAVCSGYIVEV